MQAKKDVSPDSITAWARLFRVSQAMLAAADAELKSNGFPPLAWYDALLELRRVGPKGMRPFELQEQMLLAQYNISRLIDRLHAAGYLERRKCLDDGRGHSLHITASGENLLDEMWPVYRSIIARSFADRLDADDIDSLNDIFQRLAKPSVP